MAYEGSDEWAIIRSGASNKIKTIRLTDWLPYEWSDFQTVKKDGEIVWFDEKEEAVEFIFEHFEVWDIDDELIDDQKLPGDYHW